MENNKLHQQYSQNRDLTRLCFFFFIAKSEYDNNLEIIKVVNDRVICSN